MSAQLVGGLLEAAFKIAFPEIEKVGWEAAPEWSKQIVALIGSAGESEFLALAKKTTTSYDDTALLAIYASVQAWFDAKGHPTMLNDIDAVFDFGTLLGIATP